MSQYFDNDKNIKSEKRLIKFNFNNKEFSIYSDNGVFSKDRFDYGTRVLLSSIDIDSLSGNVLDLGCGLGVVGIILGTFNKNISIDMVDVNERALDLTKDNLILNNISTYALKSNIVNNIEDIIDCNKCYNAYTKDDVEYMSKDDEDYDIFADDDYIPHICKKCSSNKNVKTINEKINESRDQFEFISKDKKRVSVYPEAK